MSKKIKIVTLQNLYILEISISINYFYFRAFKRKLRRDNIGPGPAAYNVPLNKKQCPAYSMKFRHKSYDFSRQIPGPKYSYDIHLYKKRMPTYSFGVRYSECTAVAITPEDQI